MSRFSTINILDLVENIGEDETKEFLFEFKCTVNPEIESFLHNNALEFAKRKMSITYFVVDDEGHLIAYFTLTHKPALVPCELLSKNSRKKMERHARIDEATNAYTVSAFLIAQFGKNEQYVERISYQGIELMDQAMEILLHVQRIIGGGIVFLECEEREKLLRFYQNEHNNFFVYGERNSESEKIKSNRMPLAHSNPEGALKALFLLLDSEGGVFFM